jgi:hypothetical protein
MKLPTLSQQPDRPKKTAPAPHVAAAHAAVEKGAKVRLNVDLPEELHRRVKAKAAGEGRTIREVVLEFLATYSK